MSKYVTEVQRSTTFQLASPPFSKEGYAIVGWNDDSDKTATNPKYSPKQTIQGGFANDKRLYAVWKKDFSQCTMTVSPTSYSYSGSSDSYPITSVGKPTVTVTDPDGAPMTQDVDYSVTYLPASGNIAAGTTAMLSAVATATADYYGQLTKAYTATYTQNVNHRLDVYVVVYENDGTTLLSAAHPDVTFAGCNLKTPASTDWGTGIIGITGTQVVIKAFDRTPDYIFDGWLAGPNPTVYERQVQIGSSDTIYTAKFRLALS